MLTQTVTRTLTGSPRCCQEAHSCAPVTFDIALIRWCRRHQDSGRSYWKCTMHNSTAILHPDAHLMAPCSVCLERRGYVTSAFSWQFWPRHSEIRRPLPTVSAKLHGSRRLVALKYPAFSWFARVLYQQTPLLCFVLFYLRFVSLEPGKRR